MTHHRHDSMRLQHWDYSWSAAYFITVCTKQRLPILGKINNGIFYTSPYGHIVHAVWFDLMNYYDCYLDEFVTMPDHIHGIIFIKRPNMHESQHLMNRRIVGAIHELPLRFDGQNNDAYRKIRRQMIMAKMIGRFKMQSGKMINELRGTPSQTVWQRDYYERIIKSDTELHRVRQYIINNPRNCHEH